MRILFYLYNSQLKTLISRHETFQTFNQYCFKHSYSIISTTDSSVFTTSFLENQCGLSGNSLIRASNLLNLQPSDERPPSVLKLFQTFGFPQSSITKIVSWYPHILQFHPQKILKPKLDFLVSITHSQTDFVNIITRNPNVLRSSLNNQIIPAFNLLNSLTASSYHNAATAFGFSPSNKNSFVPNIEFLLTIGVPRVQIFKLATCYGEVLGDKHDHFCKNVMKVKDMGFDLSSSYFLKAVEALSYNTDSTWESRCQLLTSFGFSDDEILSMFKKFPTIMYYTEKNVGEKMEFFLNKLGWSPSRLSATSGVLNYSLEKRTIPRCSVLQVLVSKNSTTKSFNLSTVLPLTETKFVKGFVTAHKNDVPEVVDAHQGKLRFDKYTI